MTIPHRLAVEVEELRSSGLTIDVIEDGNRCYLVFRDFVLPDCYQPGKTDVMVMADYLYPQSPLDMFWTEPHVTLPNGQYPQNANSFEQHCGRSWQRWSYHYAWNHSQHSLRSHLSVVHERLSRGC